MDGVTYTRVNVGVEPKVIKEDAIARLRSHFDYNKLTTGLLPVEKIIKCVDESKIPQNQKERERMMNIAKLTATDGKFINFNSLATLAANQIDVNMLHRLFTIANTDVKYERVEFFLDIDEMMALLKKLDVHVERKVFEEQLDKLDKDADGRVDWEEFLTVTAGILGSFITIDKNDTDGTDFNQLRESTINMKGMLINTNLVIEALDEQINKKKAEIEKRIKDTTLDDIRKKLKKEWDDKDRMEMGLLDMKLTHFNKMKDLLLENDDEKLQLVDKFRESIRTRDHVRAQIDRIRGAFQEKFASNFMTVKDIMSVLAQIDQVSSKVHEGLGAAKGAMMDAKGIWKATTEFEKPPAVSSSDGALDYLNKQNSVMSEITTKMQMMQRERDKYEDMIEEEVAKNKEKRIECVNLNMKITNMETAQMALESKFKDMKIQNTTLSAELKKKLGDTDSKKIKELKNTCFQFGEERDTVIEQVEIAKAKLKKTEVLLKKAKLKSAQLNIELGELKILLEDMGNVKIGEHVDNGMPML